MPPRIGFASRWPSATVQISDFAVLTRRLHPAREKSCWSEGQIKAGCQDPQKRLNTCIARGAIATGISIARGRRKTGRCCYSVAASRRLWQHSSQVNIALPYCLKSREPTNKLKWSIGSGITESGRSANGYSHSRGRRRTTESVLAHLPGQADAIPFGSKQFRSLPWCGRDFRRKTVRSRPPGAAGSMGKAACVPNLTGVG